MNEDARDALISRIYSDCDTTIPTQDTPGNMFLGLLQTIFWRQKAPAAVKRDTDIEAPDAVMAWYMSELAPMDDLAPSDWESGERYAANI